MRELLRETARGLRRDRALAIIMIAGLAVGVTDWQLTDLLWREQQHSAIEEAPSLFAVELDRDRRFDFLGDGEGEKTNMLLRTYLALRDADALAVHPALIGTAMTASGSLAVSREGGAPEELPARFASSSMFAMFAIQFRSGSAFHDGADEAVVSDELDRRWFPDTGSIGKTFRIGGRRMRITGVLRPDHWPRQFDARLPRIEGLFLSMEAFRRFRPWPDPILSTTDPAAFFAHPGSAEDPVVRLFVEVPPEGRGAYEAFLQRYLASQQQRSPRMTSARLVPWAEWADFTRRAEPVYVIVRGMGLLVLAGCAFNLVRLAIVRSGARAGELGILRAMGESRRSLLIRQLVEAALMGLGAGVLGLILLAFCVPAFNSAIPPRPMTFFLDAHAAVASLVVGPVAAVLSALYPAWRFSRMAPAALLRRQ